MVNRNGGVARRTIFSQIRLGIRIEPFQVRFLFVPVPGDFACRLNPRLSRTIPSESPICFFVCSCIRRFRLSAQSPAIENNSFGIVHACIEYEPIRQSLSAGQFLDSRSVEGVGENEIRIKQRLSVGQIFDSRSVEGKEWVIDLP